MRLFEPRRAIVLSATCIGHGQVNVVLPGGESSIVDIPEWEQIKRLPDDMPLIQKVAIAFGFKQASAPLSVLAYDFESFTPGISPNPDNDRLLSCGFYGDDFASVFRSTKPADVLNFFVTTVREKNPDVLAGFFANRYDMLLALAEARRLGVPLPLGRCGDEPEVIYRRFDSADESGERFKVKTIKIDGRLHFDVFDEVLYDQSLIGIKGHGLKDVGKFLKIPRIVEVDRKQVAKLKSEDLLDYNLSDARLTYILTKTYLANLNQLCDMMDLPMNLVMERTPSHIPNYFYGRRFLERDESYFGDNQSRYPEIFNRPGNSKAYQGAYVDIFRYGIVKPLTKLDAVNMYSAFMVAGNLDPWTMALQSIAGCTNKPPRFKLHDGSYSVTVSDSLVGDVTSSVDISEDSVTRTELTKFIKAKRELKARSKTDPLANSQYWVVKLVLNATSGYHGLKYAKWGNVLVIMTTTAFGRYELRGLVDMAREDDEEPIEGDTDGLYIAGDITDKQLSNYQSAVRDMFPDWFNRDFIELDADHFDAGLFIDEKNYVLKDGEKILFHGAGLKGKHLPAVCDKPLQSLIMALFDDKSWRPVLHEAKQLSSDVEDFVMKAQFNKVGYEGNSLYAQLEKKLHGYGVNVGVGDTVRYVKTKEGYDLADVVSRSQIDESYYLKRIADICARALSPIQKMNKKEVLEIVVG